VRLVAGRSSCTAPLPDTVRARELALFRAAGEGELRVAATWPELQESCILVVRPQACDPESAGAGGINMTPPLSYLTSKIHLFWEVIDGK
jgi:hypothetical protein